MGLGDDIMATGQARALKERHPHSAIVVGDGTTEHWSAIFDGNPDITRLAEVKPEESIIWLANYPGKRPYLGADSWSDRLPLIPYQPVPGKIIFSKEELKKTEEAVGHLERFILIEPNVKGSFSALNKDWGWENWISVSKILGKKFQLVQVGPPSTQRLPDAIFVNTDAARLACAILARAALYLGPEGGLHHAAAAVETPAVVVFGSYISPENTGYESQTNLYSPISHSPCGSKIPCRHCLKGMSLISPLDVVAAVLERLKTPHADAQELLYQARTIKWQTPRAVITKIVEYEDKIKTERRVARRRKWSERLTKWFEAIRTVVSH